MTHTENLAPYLTYLENVINAVDAYVFGDAVRISKEYGINKNTFYKHRENIEQIKEAYAALKLLDDAKIEKYRQMYRNNDNFADIYGGTLAINNYFACKGLHAYCFNKDDKKERNVSRTNIRNIGIAQEKKETQWSFTGQDMQFIHRGFWV